MAARTSVGATWWRVCTDLGKSWHLKLEIARQVLEQPESWKAKDLAFNEMAKNFLILCKYKAND